MTSRKLWAERLTDISDSVKVEMSHIQRHPRQSLTSPSRRRLLEVGCLSPLGLSWADLLRADDAEASSAIGHKFGQARSCVVIFLWGGPGQQDLWDLKPEAPVEQRGEFRPAQSNVSGIQLSDQLPHLCRQADKFSIIRSVSHRDFEHGSAAYSALTGHPHPRPGTNTPAGPDDFPTYGAVSAKLGANRRPVPDSVVLGPVMHQGNRPPLAGQNAGFLGLGYEPFRVADDPSGADFHVSALDVPTDMTSKRLDRRYQLLKSFDSTAAHLQTAREVAGAADLYERAFSLLRSRETQNAFEIDRERPEERERYGQSKFGQTLLLTRRLVQAGVPLVTVNWAKQNRDQWDTHTNNYSRLRKLLPPFDQGLAAFFDDLQTRGLLESTLVVCLGEFGRTPKMNKDAGRDHWPDCYSVVMSGGGIQPGTVFGSSNRIAAYPASDAVAPWDLSATIFHCLGINPGGHIHDSRGRPYVVSPGRVIEGLL